ncbi:hypothetical protein F5Y02DRAFT_416948 [Annulohypoxylon stygium]|nr:hypothetical protein F5Y02DRAFT_416948 [Annulohypoxylon stygium]
MKLRYEDDEDGRHLRYEANIKSEAIITEDWSDDLASDIDELTFGTPSKVTRVKETRDIILSRPSTKKTNPKKALACPFLKHNPERYQEDKPCSCTSWETASRVKEHVFRRHVPSGHRCFRCRELFESASILYDHQRAIEPCEMRAEDPDDISEVQVQALRSKKKPAGRGPMSEEDKWEEMYKILFPLDDVAVVSPYYDARKNISDRDFLVELEGILRNNQIDQHKQDNIINQVRSVLRRADGKSDTNSSISASPTPKYSETQDSREADTQDPWAMPRFETSGLHAELGDILDLGFQRSPIDSTTFSSTLFEDWPAFLENHAFFSYPGACDNLNELAHQM